MSHAREPTLTAMLLLSVARSARRHLSALQAETFESVAVDGIVAGELDDLGVGQPGVGSELLEGIAGVGEGGVPGRVVDFVHQLLKRQVMARFQGDRVVHKAAVYVSFEVSARRPGNLSLDSGVALVGTVDVVDPIEQEGNPSDLPFGCERNPVELLWARPWPSRDADEKLAIGSAMCT